MKEDKEQIARYFIAIAAHHIDGHFYHRDHQVLSEVISMLAAYYALPVPPEGQIIEFAISLVKKVRTDWAGPTWNSRRFSVLTGTEAPRRKTKSRVGKLSAHLHISPNTQRAKINHDKPRRLVPTKLSERQISGFYDSWEWKRLRYDFLKDKQRRCQCCGATPESGVRIVVDHIKPIRHYWHLRLDSANLQILCDDCNMGKGSRDETNWSNVVPFKRA